MERIETLAVIPARGGSTELRRKNLLPDPNGVPLVLVSARAARDAGCHVVVSTDDAEIAALARGDGHRVHPRGTDYADVPVDEVVQYVVDMLGWDGPVLLVQPTVQPMTTDWVRWCLAKVYGTETPSAFGVEDRHLTWMDGWLRTPRVQRQDAAAWPVREVGVRWWPGNRVSPPSRVITSPHHLVDVDTADDYRSLERRLKIQFSVHANQRLGWGHLHRALTLAEGLQHHDVAISLVPGGDQAAREFLADRWPLSALGSPLDVLVHDSLDYRTEGWYANATVALETTLDDATVSINAMYGHGDYTGPRYAVLRPEFTTGNVYEVRDRGQRVMVMFGGTDPSGLTKLATDALIPDGVSDLMPPGMAMAYREGKLTTDMPRPGDRWQWTVDVIRPADNRNIAAAMRLADLLITSGGRTVYEAAAVGVPTIVMCQNQRELTHQHLGVGNLNLGLGVIVDPGYLVNVVDRVLDDYDLRCDLSATARSSIDGKGADRIRAIIEHVGRFGEKP